VTDPESSEPPPYTPSSAEGGDHIGQIAAGLAALRAGDLSAALDAFAAAHASAVAGGDLAGQADALRHQSFVWRQRSDWSQAMECAERAVEVAESAGMRDPLAEALNAKATVYQAQGDFDRAEPVLREAAALSFDPKVQALIYANLGAIAAERGDLVTARKHFLASAERFRRAGYHFGEAVTLNNFGRVALDVGNPRIALPMLQDARGAARRAADAELLGIVQTNLAEAHERLGQIEEGTQEANDALAAFTRLANHARRAECLRVLGTLAASAGDRGRAREHYERALEAADAAGMTTERERIEIALKEL
jgi:tetratricopeptide (TPR) repeat protein